MNPLKTKLTANKYTDCQTEINNMLDNICQADKTLNN